MHRYMRAIGFSKLNRKKLQGLVTDVIVNSKDRLYTSLDDENIVASFKKEIAPGVGIIVVGQFDENDQFAYDYYFPYIDAELTSTEEDVSVERHAATESYAGVFEDPRMGITIIFYLQNMIPYVKALRSDILPIKGTTLSLSALSLDGIILMPLHKTINDVVSNIQNNKGRNKLLLAAKSGDEEAIESLTLNDMDTYTTLAQKIKQEDLYTIVDTSFMPFGVECDQYSIVGEIIEYDEVVNAISGETVYRLQLLVNDVMIRVAVNKADVFGEPAVGRRYKGNIWLQGKINFPS